MDEINDLEAQIAALKQKQENQLANVGGEDIAMTPRGGGANAVRALRKVTAENNSAITETITEATTTGDTALCTATTEGTAAATATTAATAATATTATTATTSPIVKALPTENVDEHDDLDLQLYANNGFFPAYVAATETSTNQNEAAPTTSDDKIAVRVNVDAPPNWVAIKTRGKFGKIYWYNTVTGKDYYNEAPPTLELLAQWEEEAAKLIAEGAERQRKEMARLAAESGETEKNWKAKLKAERDEKERLLKEAEAERVAAAAKIPAWKKRLMERKAKKAAEAAKKNATAITTTDPEPEKENHATNPKSPTTAPVKMEAASVLSTSVVQ
jgi:hypothetical protein